MMNSPATRSILFTVTLATAACSTTTPAARVVTAATAAEDRPGAIAAGPKQAQPASPCRATAAPAVIARHVFVPAGVRVLERDGAFDVRFASSRAHCASVLWSSARTESAPASCPGSPSDPRASRTLLGFARDSRQPAWLGWAGDPREQDVGDAQHGILSIGPDRAVRFVIDDGYLNAQIDVRGHAPVSVPTDLVAPDSSAIGTADAAMNRRGDGLVVFIASRGQEFDVFATPIACAAH